MSTDDLLRASDVPTGNERHALMPRAVEVGGNKHRVFGATFRAVTPGAFGLRRRLRLGHISVRTHGASHSGRPPGTGASLRRAPLVVPTVAVQSPDAREKFGSKTAHQARA